MSQIKNNKTTEADFEALRLEYCFEKGVNIRDRIIQITGEITDQQSFDWLDAAMNEMEHESKKSITLKLNSPGGSVYEALAMVDRIRDSKCQVITKCYGHAMSAAGLILASGDKRLIGSRSWFMHHEMSSGTEGTYASMVDEVQQMEREMREWSRSMAEFSNQSAEFWLKVAHKKDFYLNATECLQLGVVDEIF
jgi:ATP-dependent Clp protease protease subunit